VLGHRNEVVWSEEVNKVAVQDLHLVGLGLPVDVVFYNELESNLSISFGLNLCTNKTIVVNKSL
jgi:hypothetical protein